MILEDFPSPDAIFDLARRRRDPVLAGALREARDTVAHGLPT